MWHCLWIVCNCVLLSSFFSMWEVVVSVGEVDAVTKTCISDTIFHFHQRRYWFTFWFSRFFSLCLKNFCLWIPFQCRYRNVLVPCAHYFAKETINLIFFSFLVNSTNALFPSKTKFLHSTIASIKFIFSCLLSFKFTWTVNTVPILKFYFSP